jgi:hypothetical protein
MESITTFLPNGPKKNAVTTAIDVKFDYAYLDELSRQLQIVEQRNFNTNVSQANTFISQLNVEKAKPIPPNDRVVQLGQQVEAFFKSIPLKPDRPPRAIKIDCKN